MKKPFTQLENETMEALARAPFTAREFRVMLAVIRLTNGFHLTETKVLLPDLLLLTGLARNHLQATMKRLSQWQVVVYAGEGVIACHGPALWQLPPASPDLGLANRQSGTISASPDLGLSQLVPDPDRKPDTIKKTYKEKYKENKGSKKIAAPDSRVAELMKSVEKERGWASHKHAAEAKAVKWMLGKGFTIDDIMGCWRGMLKEPFWQKTPLHMMSVASNIGQWKKGEGHGGEGGPPGVRGGYFEKGRGYRPRIGTDEEFREQARRLGQEPDNPAESGGVPRGGDADPGGLGEGPALGDTGQRPAPGNQGDLPALHPQEAASGGPGSG